MTVELIEIISFVLFFVGLLFFLSRNDEFPILLLVFFYATGIMRFNAVLSGIADWVEVAYAFSIFNLNDDLALRALNYFFWGTALFTLSYYIFYKHDVPINQRVDNQDLLLTFINKNQVIIVVLFVFFLILNSVFKTMMSGIGALAYGMSYMFLFKLAIGGLILLMFLVYKNINFRNTTLKLFYLGILLFSIYISYNPRTRFQFLSWMIALGFIIMKDTYPLRKFFIYTIGGFAVLLTFSFAGNLRHSFIRNAKFQDQFHWAIERIKMTEDQNMLDGFMMVLQVYPEHLDYHYGGEHLEILMRPIPRAWWPGKPVGGYANKLGLNTNTPGGVTIGISQSIYGSFYGEGGVSGIVVFSFIYGLIFARLFFYAKRYSSDMRYLIKGIVFASAVPLLRGGDLPGIIAFIGMSFWPVFLLLFMYNRFLKRQHVQRSESTNIGQESNPVYLG